MNVFQIDLVERQTDTVLLGCAMCKVILFVGIFLSVFLSLERPAYAESAPAVCRPDTHGCDYYSCRGTELGCDKTNYLDNFGDFYCRKYLIKEKNFSQAGQIWLQDVRFCLQDILQEPELDCSNIENFAVHSHYACYMQTGYCGLPISDKIRVMRIAIGQAFHSDVMQVFWQITQACKNQ